MPGLYLRQKPMPDCVGRTDYLSNPEKQKEKLLHYHDGASELMPDFWQQLAAESGACQARELHGQLPNSLLDRMTPKQIAETIERAWEEETGRPCAIAIHYSPARNGQMNLHFHLMYSERNILADQQVKVAERALFFDEEGKRRYRKREILDDQGDLRPGCRIVPKGEIYERRSFGAIDNTFSSRGWLQDMKEDWFLPLINGALKGDVEFTMYDPAGPFLPQQHQGKGDNAAEIQKTNALVREFNDMVSSGEISEADARRYKELFLLAPNRLNELYSIFSAIDLQQAEPEQITEAVIHNAKLIGTDKRTRHDPEDPREIEKQELRKLYREASLAWAAYRGATDPAEKRELLKEGRAASARIDAKRRAMGDFSSDDYIRLIRKQAEQLRKERSWLRILKHRIDGAGWAVRRTENHLKYLRRQLREAEMKWFNGKEVRDLRSQIVQAEKQLTEEREQAAAEKVQLRLERREALKAYRENKRLHKETRAEFKVVRSQKAAETKAVADFVRKAEAIQREQARVGVPHKGSHDLTR